jgi:hypothetical protein
MTHERTLSDLEQLEAIMREIPQLLQPIISVQSVQPGQFGAHGKMMAASDESFFDFTTREVRCGSISHNRTSGSPRFWHIDSHFFSAASLLECTISHSSAE